MSEPYFIGRFLLRLQSKHKQAPPNPPLALINFPGETFPIALDPSSPKFLARLFKRLMSSMSLESEPQMVGVSNDLVLCCITKYRQPRQRDYLICNPYTTQWVALPPSPSRHLFRVPVGFICDNPFYKCYKKDEDRRGQASKYCSSSTSIFDDGHGQLININIKYRYKVVRILPTLYDGKLYDYDTSEFRVEIFSSETGKWKESIILFPRKFCFDDVQSNIYFAHHGMLYWSSIWAVDEVFLIGLDPFIISSHTNDNNSGDYGCRYIKLIIKDPAHKLNKLYLDYQTKYLGVRPGGGGGCLQMCFLDKHENSLIVWELKEEEDFMVEPDGAQVWCSKEKRLVLNNMEERVDLIGFDPQEEGFLYIVLNEIRFVKINVHTGSLAQEIIDVVSENISSFCFFPLRVDPRWPTPVPRLPRTSTT